MCPTSPRRLIDATLDALLPLCPDGLARDDVSGVLEQIVAGGDLLELPRGDGLSTRLLYLGPPSYIERQPGTHLLMGIRPFGAPIIDEDLIGAITYRGHMRLLELDPASGPEWLEREGIRKIHNDRWVDSSAVIEPGELIEGYGARLNIAGEAGQIDGLQILDPAASVRFYRRRWRAPMVTDSGDFVARRPKAYGADLWCLVRIREGMPHHLIDLPIERPVGAGHDEAWRYQAAVDSRLGTPQVVAVERSARSGDSAVIDFFSPLPAFADRFIQLLGDSISKSQGALFSYQVPDVIVPEILDYLSKQLWMVEVERAHGTDNC